jgi:ribosomal protein S18 acetylase RimI-like enzyme
MKATLRPVTHDDVDAIQRLRERLFAHHQSLLNSNRDCATLKTLSAEPAHGHVWLIDCGPAVAGYAIVTFCFSIEFGGKFALLDEWYLDPEFRGQGIGSDVLHQIESAMRSDGMSAIRLEVERSNVNAERLYRRSGFEPHDRYLMTKWLHV